MINKCKICGSNDIVNYFVNDDRVLKCRKCGTGFLNDKIIPADQEYYEEASNYSAIINNPDRLDIIVKNAKNQLGFITKHLDPRDKTLLDIGAHTGMFVQEAGRSGFRAEGIEPNKIAADWALRRGISINNADLESYQPDKKYDIITLFHVLEHLSDPVACLNKLKSWLNKGGYLIIEVPNSDSYLAKLDGISWKYIALEHVYYFSQNSLGGLLKDLGFTIIVFQKRNFEINYLNLRKLAHYIWGKKIIRDRFQGKNPRSNQVVDTAKKNSIKGLIGKFMIQLVCLLRREDHILIIACKK